MRTLGATFDTESSKTITRPTILVKLGFALPASPSWLSSGGTVTALSETWTGADIKIRGVSQSSVDLEIGNVDLAIGTSLLTNETLDLPVEVYLAYGDTTAFASSAVEQVFAGSLVQVPTITEKSVRIRAEVFSERKSIMPRYRIAEPTFNHLPPPDFTLTIGGNTITMPSDRDRDDDD
jgi:hypothetical protein